ncbi:unnamed protein product [Rotaria magnacalcarata]|uniref:NELL2-like EGF domain-containing protein n=1 Tax=Rotaria magnacalcarata TaxID=392030 RepID=A0A816MW53_9BILA|nr:unnamed protein product [Rotaria magnacalcarata]CAF4270645.1 unnamed protein product [Rotaria magnacalcarata]
MVLHGRLLYAWLPLMVILLQAFHGRFVEGSCSKNNGGCGKNALCSENRKTSAIKCTCKTGYTNTGSAVHVVCKDSCTIKNGGCGPHAACSHHAKTNAVQCTKKAGHTNTVNIRANAKWSQNGGTIAGGNGQGGATNQLNYPHGLVVNGDQTVIIADSGNHRIMQLKNGDTTNGHVVAGGNVEGNGLHQLRYPTDVLIDKETDSLIICDAGNRRVVRWSRRSGTTQGEILIDNINCYGLAMDEQRYLYVPDYEKHEVRRYKFGENIGTLVAGGNGKGVGLNQLNTPRYIFVDRQQNVYVSDYYNHRVMKWNKGATEGIVVAGGQGAGSALTQLYYPEGIFVDRLGTLYIADFYNHRVIRWAQGATQGTVIVGGNGQGAGANQFYYLIGLSFDRYGNLFVVDLGNHRVQRFSIE